MEKGEFERPSERGFIWEKAPIRKKRNKRNQAGLRGGQIVLNQKGSERKEFPVKSRGKRSKKGLGCSGKETASSPINREKKRTDLLREVPE